MIVRSLFYFLANTNMYTLLDRETNEPWQGFEHRFDTYEDAEEFAIEYWKAELKDTQRVFNWFMVVKVGGEYWNFLGK